MGTQVKAICQCGLEKDILIGGGKLNHKTTSYFPCYCRDCKDVVQGNLKQLFKRCPNHKSHRISSYTKRELIGIEGKGTIVEQGKHKLTNGTYKCPRCEQMTLHFQDTQLFWD